MLHRSGSGLVVVALADLVTWIWHSVYYLLLSGFRPTGTRDPPEIRRVWVQVQKIIRGSIAGGFDVTPRVWPRAGFRRTRTRGCHFIPFSAPLPPAVLPSSPRSHARKEKKNLSSPLSNSNGRQPTRGVPSSRFGWKRSRRM